MGLWVCLCLCYVYCVFVYDRVYDYVYFDVYVYAAVNGMCMYTFMCVVRLCLCAC